MKNKNYKPFFVFVLITTFFIVAIQLYWNYRMYKTNKQQYLFKVEHAFDEAVEAYYFELGKADVLTIMDTSTTTKNDSLTGIKFLDKNPFGKISTFFKKNGTSKSIDFSEIIDSSQSKNDLLMVTGKSAMDENIYSEFKINTITFNLTRDTIDFKLLRKITDSVFLKKNIKSLYNLIHYKSDTIFESNLSIESTPDLLDYNSDSTYIPKLQKLELQFNNSQKQAFLNGLLGLILSLVLSLGIIFSIYRLIETIKKQKKLSDLKDDFISNVTHEFRTPIATVSAAIEAIDKFSLIDDKEKTKKYLAISNQQLQKLDVMVEKLLETSAIDEDNIILNKELVDVLPIIQKQIAKYHLIAPDKTLTLNKQLHALEITIDPFYLSSVISNLLDNAVKYGGPNIKVKISKGKTTTIAIIDNGNALRQSDASFIFDKFSRKSTGNLHEVKGNGIGLYFSKRIMEKHGGSLLVKINEGSTSFIISL